MSQAALSSPTRQRRTPAHTLGWALRWSREAKGWSARDLSLRAGLSESYVGKLEGGSIEPSLHAFSCLARALELTNHEIAFLARLESLKSCHTPSVG